MDELELLFEDEAGVYLPQVVANENERKLNESERKRNENERQRNESQRIENEEKRINSMEQFESMKDELIASVKGISFTKEYKATYTTTTINEDTFKIPSEYTETSMVWVYVNGMKLNANEYTIDTNNSLVVLTNALDVIGTIVEVAVYRLTTAKEEDYETLRGTDGLGVPTGGTAGQVLSKRTNTDNDTEWIDIESSANVPTKTSELENDSGFITNTSNQLIPTGGTIGQVLAKKSNADNDIEWINQTGGGSSGDLNFTSIYKGKKLSILGDSISTFTGYIPSGNAVYYNGSKDGVSSVEDTWWKKVINALEMELDTNNSWSGSRVTTTNGTQSAGCMTRCENLGNPDVIIVYLGINDFNNEVALGTYDGTNTFPTTTTTFREAYSIMLNKILNKYPKAEILVCTLPYCEKNGDIAFPEKNGNDILLKEFNKSIRDLADLFNVNLIDLAKCGLTYQNMYLYMGDYSNSSALHPNSFGHSLIANYVIKNLDNTVRTRYDVETDGLIYSWDFTKSLTDTVSGKVTTLNGATQSQNGLTFSNSLDYADCGNNIMGRNKTIEIDFGNMTSDFSNINGIFFWVTIPEAHGFGWNNKVNNYGGFWNTEWVNLDNTLSKNNFANSTLKITIDVNGVVRYYKKTEEGIIEYSAKTDQNKPITDDAAKFVDSDTVLRLGSNSSAYPAFHDMTIKAVRVYNGVN